MRTMKLNVSASYQDVLRLKGVPLGLLKQPTTFDLEKTFYDYSYYDGDKDSKFSSVFQIKVFDKLIKEPPKSNNVILFTGRQDYRRTRLLCVVAFGAFLEKGLNPLWYMANANFEKTVLEVIENKALFIDSITDQMSQYKYDKIHDMCQKHCDKVQVLIHHGREGYDFCIDRLGIKPSIVFNMDKNIGKKVITL